LGRGPRHAQRAADARDRRLLISEGLFSGTATATHQTFFVTLLVQLHVSNGALGLYTAFNGLLANASGLAGGRVGRRLPNRQLLAALSGGLGRLGFLAIALLLLARGSDASTTLLILVALASATLIGLGLPILTSMVADEVEPSERGAFFANRLLASGIGTAAVALGIAALLKRLSFPNGFTVAYLLAAAAGIASMVAILQLRRTPPPALAGAQGAPQAHGPISRQMWRFASGTFVLWFGAAMVGPILTPYILDDLGASASFMGLTSAVNAIVALSVQRFWGRRVDRAGAYPVLRVSIIAVSALPVLYALTPTYWLALGFEVLSGVGWSGYALGNLNFAMELAPTEQRARYAAIGNAAAGVGAFLGPLTAALLAAFLPVRAVLIGAGLVRLLAALVMRSARHAEQVVVRASLAD
jgi:MFS family permease